MSDLIIPNGNADFALLGEMEIGDAADIFKGCDFIRSTASEAGIIIDQFFHDVGLALMEVPVLDPGGWHGIGADNPKKRRDRVVRHGKRCVELMKSTCDSAWKVRPEYLRTYADVVQERRRTRQGRKPFNPTGGL